MLPDMDGLEVCRRLRTNPTTQDIPILLLTAKDEVGSRVEGLNTGALDRQTILNQVWGYDFLGETNIFEVYIRYIREKIEDLPSTPRFYPDHTRSRIHFEGITHSRMY
jgi:DNA-binding response OmpR family regulator